MRYQSAVYNMAYRMLGDPTEAEDAAQEVFVRAWNQLHTFQLDRRFSTWLLSIASHYSIDLLRRRRPTAPLDDVALYVESDDPAPEDVALQGERAEMEPAARAAARHADPRQEHEDEARHGDEEKRVGRAAIGLRGEPRRDEGHDGAERDRDEVLAEEQEPVAEALLSVEVAHIEDHHDAETHQRAHREDEPRIAAERVPDPWTLAAQRTAEGGLRRRELAGPGLDR